MKRLFIITGDPSGDVHAANVVRSLKELEPTIEVAAVGGPALREAGATLLSDQAGMGRVGAGGVLSARFHFLLGRKILKFLETFKPDGVLLVDYGGFNILMAGQLKKRGIPVFYFIPPQVWASRKGRLKHLRKSVSHVFCIFPFEEELYQQHRIPVTYVGHPLVGKLPPAADRQAFCERHGLDPSRPIIALMPGSRKMEIDYLLSPIIQAAALIQQAKQGAVQFVLAKADSLESPYFQARLQDAAGSLNGSRPVISILEHENHAVQSVADAAIVASGTATLETALYQTPMVIVYKGHWLVAALARRLCYLPCIGLPNILTDMNRPIARELLQEDVTPGNIRDALLPLLDPQSHEYVHAKAGFAAIAQKLGTGNATQRVASELIKLL